jgi:hypothetical protein
LSEIICALALGGFVGFSGFGEDWRGVGFGFVNWVRGRSVGEEYGVEFVGFVEVGDLWSELRWWGCLASVGIAGRMVRWCGI